MVHLKKATKSNKEVQTETIFYPYICFYFESRLETKELMKGHAEVCHGRHLNSFNCEQYCKNFDDASELKNHVVKVHDPAKLLHCLQELLKPKENNFKCKDCGLKFEFDSELELHMLTAHVYWK